MKNVVAITISAVALATLGACATSNPDVIQRGEAQRMSQVLDATVLSVRAVTIDGSQSGGGAVAGGLVGAIAGSSAGGGYRDNQVGSVIGAVAGAVIGNAVERSATKDDAFEIILQLRNGERRAVIQGKGSETFNPGDAVLLVITGGKTRVMHAPPVTAPAPVPAPAQ